MCDSFLVDPDSECALDRSLRKSRLLLSALERQKKKVSYFALDVSRAELIRNLRGLTESPVKWHYVDFCGLLGTYEDCVAWLPHYQKLGLSNSITFLWMGSSIGNLDPLDASSLLSSLVDGCQKSQLDCRFLLAVDGCRQDDQVHRAYDTRKQPLRLFILNGLQHANALIGFEAFRSRDWTCVSQFDNHDGLLRVLYLCQRNSKLDIDGKQVHFKKGGTIQAICSRKLTEGVIKSVCGEAAMDLVETWRGHSRDYSKPITLRSYPLVVESR